MSQQIANAAAIDTVDTSAEGSTAGEYLTFRLGDEEYGIDILRSCLAKRFPLESRILITS